MVRNRPRKTSRGTSAANFKRAASDVQDKGISVREAARDHNIPKTSFQRYLKASAPEKLKMGSYKGVSDAQSVFTSAQAAELADYIKTVDNLFHGLSATQCRELAYQYAAENKLATIPNSWERNKIAGLS